MYIQEIKLKKLFDDKNIKWQLNPSVNILGGINGSGKSTILKSIYYILKGERINFLYKLFEEAEITLSNNFAYLTENTAFKEQPILRTLSKKITINTTTNQEYQASLNNDLKVYFISSIEPSIIQRDKNVLINKEIKTTLDLELYKAISKRNEINSSILFENDETRQSFFKQNRFFFEIINNFFHDTDKELDMIPQFRFRLKKAKSINNEATIKINLKRTLEQLNVKIKELEKSIKKYNWDDYKLDDYKLESLKDTNYIDNYIKNQSYKQIYKKLTQAKLSTIHKFDEFKKDYISCYKLSTGEKQLLYILLSVYNTSNEHCIILMDEPDLGLHIDWKKELIGAITEINPNAQIILSTHSPSMISGYFNCVKEIKQLEY